MELLPATHSSDPRFPYLLMLFRSSNHHSFIRIRLHIIGHISICKSKQKSGQYSTRTILMVECLIVIELSYYYRLQYWLHLQMLSLGYTILQQNWDFSKLIVTKIVWSTYWSSLIPIACLKFFDLHTQTYLYVDHTNCEKNSLIYI